MRNSLFILGILSLALMLVGCNLTTPSAIKLSSYNSVETTDLESDAINNVNNNDSGTEKLTIWTTENSFQETVKNFSTAYPNVKVEIVEIAPHELVETYRNSIIDQDTPDIFMIPEENLDSFTGIQGLEDLTDEAYYDQDIFTKLPKGLLENYLSYDKKEMYTMPIWIYPFVTYYRADILEKEGFPSEPNELAAYMENENNWIQMAKKLKDNGHYILEYPQSLLSYFNRTSNYFDEQLNYLGNTGAQAKLLKVSDSIFENELYLDNNIWSTEGQQALSEDKLIMIYQPSYAKDSLKEWLPEQTGKWRATRMPFGKVGLDNETSKTMAISAYSEQKTLAWEFIKLTTNDMINMYWTDEKDDFFGGQNLNKLNQELISTDVPGIPTPIDSSAFEVWKLYLYKFNTGDTMNNKVLSNIERDVNERIRLSKRALLNY